MSKTYNNNSMNVTKKGENEPQLLFFGSSDQIVFL